MNGKSVTIQVDPYKRTDQVLEGVASHIQLAPRCTYFFNLFLEQQEEGQPWTGGCGLTIGGGQVGVASSHDYLGES